jgi:hypothetical protein
MRLRLALFLWALGILFPLAWLGRFSTAYRQVFDTIFGPGWMHVLMHLALFAGLGMLLLAALKPSLDRWALLKVGLALLLVGALQEGFQTLSQGASLASAVVLRNAAFDLGVDLTGGLAGLLLAAFYMLRSSPQSIKATRD